VVVGGNADVRRQVVKGERKEEIAARYLLQGEGQPY
jgi:hypothetical protein